jgi:osmoprotectant transport system ATP-binding protein
MNCRVVAGKNDVTQDVPAWLCLRANAQSTNGHPPACQDLERIDRPQAGRMSLVEFRGVTCAYGDRRALTDLNLSVGQGEALALVGRSGAGKSTLLKLVNRMLIPQQGSVLVDGRDTREWNPIQLRRRTGYVLQSIGLFPHLTVEQNISLVPRLEGWDVSRREARARELLELVGLAPDDYAHRWPNELSGGQQQRVGVARALAINPPVLLMDEPFGALDPVTRRELQRAFSRIQQELRQTVLLVTHDIAEAVALGTRVGILDDGALIICDTPAVILRATDARVRRFLEPVRTATIAG